MSIIFKNLENLKNTASDTERATFVDVALDTSFNYRDLNVSFDEKAIKNALICLFNTKPGENILFPDFGLDLHRNLFEQLTEANGYDLTEKIRSTTARYEPRVQIEKINVIVNKADLAYEVEIFIKIPALKQKTTLTGIFDNALQFRLTERL